MSRDFHPSVTKAGQGFIKVLLLAAVVLSLSTLAAGQTVRQVSPNDSVSADKSAPGEEQRGSNPIEDEMRAKRAIKFAENAHKENLDRAREVFDLGEKLQTSFEAKKSLDREDAKRLERLEKLTKQLRSKAGGSSTDEPLEDRPTDLSETVKRIKEATECLSKEVEKTPRQVVSAVVIDEANVLLQLIEIARQYSR